LQDKCQMRRELAAWGAPTANLLHVAAALETHSGLPL